MDTFFSGKFEKYFKFLFFVWRNFINKGRSGQSDFDIDNFKINIDCYPIDASLSLYNYNLNLAVNDFHNLGKSFRQCDDIFQIFETLRNILSSSNNSNIEISTNDDITLVIPNKLSYGSMENIRILFINTWIYTNR